MFSRKTCVFLNFSSYSQVYTARCTTYNQGMPNSNISFYLYQIVESLLLWNHFEQFLHSNLFLVAQSFAKVTFLCISWTVQRHCSIFCESSSLGSIFFSAISHVLYVWGTGSLYVEISLHHLIHPPDLPSVTFWEGMKMHSPVQGVHFHCLGLALFLQCSNQIGLLWDLL